MRISDPSTVGVSTVFPVSGTVDGPNDWDVEGELSGRLLLDWRRMREMADGGIRFDGHTKTRPRLPSLAPAPARDEVGEYGGDLERTLRTPVATFAFRTEIGTRKRCGQPAKPAFSSYALTLPGRAIQTGRHSSVDRIEIRGSRLADPFTTQAGMGG